MKLLSFDEVDNFPTVITHNKEIIYKKYTTDYLYSDKIPLVLYARNRKDGDVVLYGEQEYVYNNGIWVLFGDATGNAAAITALAERVTDVETAVNTTLPGAIAQALTDAKTYTDQEIGKIVLPGAAQQSILGLIKGTDNKVNVADGEITGISTDLLFQGLNELILNGGNADVAASN